MLKWLAMPVAASAHSGDVDQVIALVHWLMLVLFVGWSVFFVYVLIRFRRRAHLAASHHGLRGRWTTWIEGGVLAAEIVLLAFFSIPAWSARVDAFPPERRSTVVRVVAEQFAWNVHYPGADGRFGRTDLPLVGPTNPLGLDRNDPAAKDDATTINRFNLPIDRPAIVYLLSKDMVHSLGLPQMRVKQDAVPGIAQPLWFTPTRIGEWEIACSQLCGLGHYRMKDFYAIQPQADFDAWFAGEVAALAAQ